MNVVTSRRLIGVLAGMALAGVLSTKAAAPPYDPSPFSALEKPGHSTVASRFAVFPALPPGGKYELVLNGAEHSAFSDRALPGDKEKRNPNHHRAILALSTAFWDAWLREDAEARAWLDGAGPSSVLEKQDRWQKK